MKVAVMQPYFFPYLGYYQLVKAVDTFVFFDDVNFIKRGWINRNQVLQQNHGYLFSVPLSKVSQNQKIKDTELCEFNKWRGDFLKLIEHNYRKAPYFPQVHPWLSDFLQCESYKTISELAIGSVRATMKYLGIEKSYLKSSELPYRKEDGTPAQEKILSICELLGANTYINPKNGVALYQREGFSSKNIDLNFINMQPVEYCQFKKEQFVPYLSMIDVLMFNDPEAIKNYLDQYTLN